MLIIVVIKLIALVGEKGNPVTWHTRDVWDSPAEMKDTKLWDSDELFLPDRGSSHL